MDTGGKQRGVQRALLTEREREVLQEAVDEDSFKDLSGYQAKVRTRVKRRTEELETDLEILDAVAPELADQVRETICGEPVGKLERLEAKVERLEGDEN